MPETQSQIEIHAPAGIAYATVWDASRYPEFLTDVIDVTAAAGPTASHQNARLQLRVVREVEVEIALEGEPNSLVTWRLKEGGGWLERYDAAFTIESVDGSREVVLRLHLDIDFAGAVPEAVVRRLFDFSVPTMLRQIKARAEMTARRAEAMVGW